jgi:DNA invertase Pin-like site-specific DNA recombinase
MIYIYIRMSHRYSAQSGISEATQLSTCRNYATSLRLNPTFGKHKFPEDVPDGVFCDRAKSAWRNKLSDRPAGAALLSILKPGDEVIFYNVERAYRTVVGFCQETEMLIENGITPHFVLNNLDFSSATGKMIGRILAVIAEYYSDMISERTKEALAIKRCHGSTGRPPRVKQGEWCESTVYIPAPKPKLIIPDAAGFIRSYVRVSHELSTESGLGLEHQRQANQAYAMRLMADNPGLKYVEETYEDLSVSAFHNQLHKREAGARLLKDCQPGDHLLFYRCDRGFRMPYDCAVTAKHLKDNGVAIHLVDSGINSMTPIGSLYIHLLSIFGSIESEIKSQRNKEIVAIARASGKPVGPVPLHCKMKRKGDMKFLTYDFKKITLHAACWILRQLGHAYQDVAKMINPVIATQHKCSLRLLRKNKLYRNTFHAQRYSERFEELLGAMPQEASKECIKSAIQLLETPLMPKLAKRAYYFNMPLENTADRLIAAGISPELVGMTPSQTQSASVPA